MADEQSQSQSGEVNKNTDSQNTTGKSQENTADVTANTSAISSELDNNVSTPPTQTPQDTPVDPETLRKERQEIAKDVQKLLTLKLEKHEIEPALAKEIALRVVEELREAKNHFELEKLIPHLSEEFAELKDILMLEIKNRRNDLDELVTKIVSELIKHKKFQEAIKAAKFADIEGEELQEFDEAEDRVNDLAKNILSNDDNSQDSSTTDHSSVQPPVIQQATPPIPVVKQPTPPTPPVQKQVQPNPTSPVQPQTQISSIATTLPSKQQASNLTIPTEGSTANPYPSTSEFPKEVTPGNNTNEDPSLTDKIQAGIGKIRPIAEKASEKAKEGIEKLAPAAKEAANKAKEAAQKAKESIMKKKNAA